MITPPPEEDSEDLGPEELLSAVPTSGPEDFSRYLVDLAKVYGRPVKHELRRKRPHLYCRTSFIDKILLFQVDWIGE